jgi:flagellin-like protein
MNTNKKAISALVATVLLVVITIAAMGMIWSSIMPIIKTNMEKSQKCFDVGLDIKQGGYTCLSPTGDLMIQVSRGEKSIEIKDLQVQIGFGGTTRSFRISNSTIVSQNSGIIPGPLEEVTYTIKPSAINLNEIDTASIAAVLKIGNSEALCPATQPVSINTC